MGGHRNADGDGRCAARVERLPPERALEQRCRTRALPAARPAGAARRDAIRKGLDLVRVDYSPLPARELAPDPRDAAPADRIATPLLILPPAPEVHGQQDVHAEDVD